MAMGRSVLVALLGLAAAIGFALACGQAANGVDACTSIEHARCNWIVQCFADSGLPNYGLPTPTSNFGPNGLGAVDECYRFYDDACLHGLVTTITPTDTQVGSCVMAINSATDCNIVFNPGEADACAFLTADAGSDADSD
jgi:hypothetical protein